MLGNILQGTGPLHDRNIPPQSSVMHKVRSSGLEDCPCLKQDTAKEGPDNIHREHFLEWSGCSHRQSLWAEM